MSEHECLGTCGETIDEPGKFEGEPAYVRDVVWEIVMNGGSDATVGSSEYGTVYDYIREPFDCEAMRGIHGVCVWEDSVGFVHCDTYATRGEFDAALARAEAIDVEQAGPQDEDIVCSPAGPLGSRVAVCVEGGEFIGEYAEADVDMIIRDYMAKHQFFPNVWDVSDHGNASLRELSS